MDTSKLQNIEIAGIDTGDYPDFCDAYIAYAEDQNGTPLTEDELDILNENREFVDAETLSSMF